MDLTPDQINQVQDKLRGAPTGTAQALITQLKNQGYNIPPQLTQASPQPTTTQALPQQNSGSTAAIASANAAPQNGQVMQPWLAGYQPTGNAVSDTVGAIGTGAINFVPSMVNDFGGLIVHPVKTIEGAAGLIQTLQRNPIDALKGMWNYFGQRYGGYNNILNTIANDPAGVAMDMSILLDGTGAILDATKVGTVSDEAMAAASKSADYGSVEADASSKASFPKNTPTSLGEKFSAAGNAINPAAMPFNFAGKFMKGAADVLGTGDKSTEVSNAVEDINKENAGGSQITPTAGVTSNAPMVRIAENAASKTFFGSTMYKVITDSVDSFDQTTLELANKMKSQLAETVPFTGDTSVDTIKNLQGVVKNAYTKLDDSTDNMFKAFEKNPTIQETPIAAQAEQYIVPALNDIMSEISKSGDSALINRFQKELDFWTGGGEGAGSTIPGYDSATPEMRAQMDAGMGGAAEPTFADAWQRSQSVGQKIPDSTTDFTKTQGLLIKYKVAMKDAMADSLGTMDPNVAKMYNEMNAKYTALRQQWEGQLSQKLMNSTPSEVLKTFVTSNNVTGIKAMKAMLGADSPEFTAVGGAALQQMFEDATDVSKSTDPVSGLPAKVMKFNAKAFNKLVDSVDDATWKELLTPEQYDNLQQVRGTTGNMEKVASAYGSSRKIREGSQTSYSMHFFRGTGALSDIFSAGIAALGSMTFGPVVAAVNAFLGFVLGDVAMAKFVASDFGQKVLSGAFGGRLGDNLLNLSQKIYGASAIAGAAGQAAQVSKAVQTGTKPQQNQLTPTQIQTITQKLSGAPEGTRQQVIAKLQSMGYQIPAPLINVQ